MVKKLVPEIMPGTTILKGGGKFHVKKAFITS
jgi:hypothetical protein